MKVSYQELRESMSKTQKTLRDFLGQNNEVIEAEVTTALVTKYDDVCDIVDELPFED